jgi:succinate dehydrogenase/fumarate reductase flavoprotein subunit
MLALFEQLRVYEQNGRAKILTGSKAQSLLTDDEGAVVGVRFEQRRQQQRNHNHSKVYAPRTIMAAGGFAASKKLLKRYSPQLAHLPTTSGAWATGDGILLATEIGAAMADMSKIQVHPTGWVDPMDPKNPSKVLAAEVLRGVGGILLDRQGRRYVRR